MNKTITSAVIIETLTAKGIGYPRAKKLAEEIHNNLVEIGAIQSSGNGVAEAAVPVAPSAAPAEAAVAAH